MEHDRNAIPTALVPHLRRGLRFRHCEPRPTLAVGIGSGADRLSPEPVAPVCPAVDGALLSRDETVRECGEAARACGWVVAGSWRF